MIGIKVQDVKVGRPVYYYSYAGKFTNSAAEKATITSDPVELQAENCVVALISATQ